MRFGNYFIENKKELCIIMEDGVIPLSSIETVPFNGDFLSFLSQIDAYSDLDLAKYTSFKAEPSDGPLYDNPSKILGIGLNYQEHASDLDVSSPKTHPVIFFKSTTSIIGHNQTIKIPKLSQRTTGEAELAIVLKKDARDVNKENWLDYVAGFITVLDMTAEDILRQNTRYLGLSKLFDTFISTGQQLITPDEIKNLASLRVNTVLNDEVMGTNIVANMTFQPDFLVSFISKIFDLKAGDIISTGTPRAAALSHGDVIECQIEGFETLRNNVVDLKLE